MAPTRQTTPGLTRFVLLPSGETLVRFADCSLLTLNSPAASFELLESDGKQTRGTCSCATSSLRPRLRMAMHLRNLLCPSAPRIFWELLPISYGTHPGPIRYFDLRAGSASAPPPSMRPSSSFKLSPAEAMARGHELLGAIAWPRSASARHIVRHADGAIRVLSLDRRAWLMLHPEGHMFSVCFPTCAGAAADLTSRSATSDLPAHGGPPPPPPPPDALRFVFCTQLHGTHIDPPPSWRHALGLARTAAAAATGGSQATAQAAAQGARAVQADLLSPYATASAEPGWVPLAEMLFGREEAGDAGRPAGTSTSAGRALAEASSSCSSSSSSSSFSSSARAVATSPPPRVASVVAHEYYALGAQHAATGRGDAGVPAAFFAPAAATRLPPCSRRGHGGWISG